MHIVVMNERTERHKCLKDWTQANARKELYNDDEEWNAGEEEVQMKAQRGLVPTTRVTLAAFG
jgi:hypothetical protein